MVARSTTIYQQKDSFYTRLQYGEVVVSLNDTETAPEFDALSTIWLFALYRKSNGVAVSCTTALNVATVTQAGVLNEPCFYIAYGLKEAY
jgi:hypothetical protein